MLQPIKILQASAGSGKTFSLTVHYLTLLFSAETKYREILAVTFTNKATEEMKTRILEVLQGLATGEDSGQINAYRELVLKAHPNLNPQSLKESADIIYRKILHDYSRFSVSTIDGFVQKVIRGFAFELGLDSGYALEMNYDKVKNELADRLDKALDNKPRLLQWIIDLALERINNNTNWNYRRELLDLSSEIFKERYQPFEQAIDTLSEVVDLDELFKDYQSLTRENIRQFEDQVLQLAGDGWSLFNVLDVDPNMLKGKSRSPLFNLKRVAEGDFSKVSNLNKLIDDPEQWFQKGLSHELYDQLNPMLKQLQEVYTNGLAEYVLAQSFNKNLYFLRLMQEMAALLKNYRDESKNLLISDAQNLLKGITDDAGDNPSFIWEKMGGRYKNFLFDEFQDTSSNQWGSFKSLLSNAIASPSNTLIDHLIVGDTKQSIYRWRNGDWNILHQQAKLELGAHNVMDDSLEENYRSTAHIINFNNRLFKDLPDLLQRQLNDNIACQEANQGLPEWWQQQGFDRVVTDVYSGAAQKLTARTLEGGTIKFQVIKTDAADNPVSKNNYSQEAINQMVAEVKMLLEEKQYQLRDICVLVRKNAEAIATVKALLDNGIKVISGEALLLANNNAIKLLLNTLNVLAGLPSNTGLYKANCISLYARLRNTSVDTAHYFALKFKTLDQLSAVLPADLCLNWQSWIQQPLPELIERIMRAYGLDQMEGHLPYLFAFRDLCGNFTRQGERGITAFLRYWNEEGTRKTLPSSENADAVQVVTIHKAKGLAFKAVLLPFCTWEINGKPNSIFWVPSAGTPYHHLQSIPLKYNKELGNSSVARPYFEELLFNNMDALNMLYVATTRSKEYLSISTMGKKTDSITNIGDLLIKVLEFDLSPEGSYLLDDPVNARQKSEDLKPSINLKVYPTSDRLSKVFDADLKRRDFDLLTGNTAGRTGSILHDVLANANTPEELDAVLGDMLAAGNFKAEELPHLKVQAKAVLEHTALQDLLRNSKQSLTEQTIVDRHGKSYRPDRVLINENGLTLIDYKFTMEQSDKHIEQVTHYRDLLLEMGYKNVQTFLFYAVTGQLKQV